MGKGKEGGGRDREKERHMSAKLHTASRARLDKRIRQAIKRWQTKAMVDVSVLALCQEYQ